MPCQNGNVGKIFCRLNVIPESEKEVILMNIWDLSEKAKFELGFIIYRGLNDALDNNKMDKDVLKDLLNWYKDNVMISYSSLKEKFDNYNN